MEIKPSAWFQAPLVEAVPGVVVGQVLSYLVKVPGKSALAMHSLPQGTVSDAEVPVQSMLSLYRVATILPSTISYFCELEPAYHEDRVGSVHAGVASTVGIGIEQHRRHVLA